MRAMLQGRALLLAVVVGMLGFAAPARAGSYRVWTCHTPDGQPAPIGDTTSGWTFAARHGDDPVDQGDACGKPGIFATMPRVAAHYDAAGIWTFTPPPATSIGAYSITWNGTVTAGGEATITRPGRLDPDYPARLPASFDTQTVAENDIDVGSVTT